MFCDRWDSQRPHFRPRKSFRAQAISRSDDRDHGYPLGRVEPLFSKKREWHGCGGSSGEEGLMAVLVSKEHETAKLANVKESLDHEYNDQVKTKQLLADLKTRRRA